jgi:hypothetical protein
MDRTAELGRVFARRWQATEGPVLHAPVRPELKGPYHDITAGLGAFSLTPAVTERDVGPRDLRASPSEFGLADGRH